MINGRCCDGCGAHLGEVAPGAITITTDTSGPIARGAGRGRRLDFCAPCRRPIQQALESVLSPMNRPTATLPHVQLSTPARARELWHNGSDDGVMALADSLGNEVTEVRPALSLVEYERREIETMVEHARVTRRWRRGKPHDYRA